MKTPESQYANNSTDHFLLYISICIKTIKQFYFIHYKKFYCKFVILNFMFIRNISMKSYKTKLVQNTFYFFQNKRRDAFMSILIYLKYFFFYSLKVIFCEIERKDMYIYKLQKHNIKLKLELLLKMHFLSDNFLKSKLFVIKRKSKNNCYSYNFNYIFRIQYCLRNPYF